MQEENGRDLNIGDIVLKAPAGIDNKQDDVRYSYCPQMGPHIKRSRKAHEGKKAAEDEIHPKNGKTETQRVTVEEAGKEITVIYRCVEAIEDIGPDGRNMHGNKP